MTENNTFDTLCATRYSCRAYSAEAVPESLLRAVLDDARLAPSACNRQPWRFAIVRSAQGRSCVQQAYNREWFASAPLYIIMCAVPAEGWVRPDDNKNHTDIDVAIATEHFCLAASAHGLGTCWVCNFKPEVLAEGLGLPEGLVPVAIMPLGFPAEGIKIPAKVRRGLDDNIIEL